MILSDDSSSTPASVPISQKRCASFSKVSKNIVFRPENIAYPYKPIYYANASISPNTSFPSRAEKM
jgi:hypothetical protein